MKKVLIITYYWPPAGGPGVQRVLKFAKYLPQFGWEPIILTVDNGNYPAVDEDLVREIPKDLKVYKTKTLEPFALYNLFRGKEKTAAVDTFTITKTGKSLKEKLGKLVRSYFFIPDARKGWKHYAVKEGLKIMEDENIDLIFSSSPPHSLQLAACELAKKSGKPWVADFRDPWSSAFWLDDMQKRGLPLRWNVAKEKEVLNRLSKFITVSKGFAEIYKRNRKDLDTVTEIIYNGYDEQDFDLVEASINEKFVIRYVGTLAQSQTPTGLFEALRNFSSDEVSVEFWGKFDDSIGKKVKDLDIVDKVRFYPYVNHRKAVELMQSSDMLVLVIPFDHYKGILTGKLYEYIATRHPILGIGPADSEVKELLSDGELGRYFSDSEGIESFIRGEMEKRHQNTDVLDQSSVEKYSRRYATEQLSMVFNKLSE